METPTQSQSMASTLDGGHARTMDTDAVGLVGWLDVVDEANDVVSAETQETESGVLGATLLHDPVIHDPLIFIMLSQQNPSLSHLLDYVLT